MKQRTEITIEIQENWLKLVCGTVSAGGFTMTALALESIAGASDAEISKVLARLLAVTKLKLDKAGITIVIPRHSVLVRYLLLPSHRNDEIEQMVNLQIFKQIPYSKEEVTIGHEIVSKESTGYAKVLVFAVEWEVALRLWQICSSAGAWSQRMTVDSLSLPFWIAQVYGSQGGGLDACVVIDHDVTQLCLCSSGKMIFSRAFRLGQKDITSVGLEGWLEQIELSFRQYRKEQAHEDPPQRFLIVAEEPAASAVVEALKKVYDVPIETSVEHARILEKKGLSVTRAPYLAGVYAVAQAGAAHALNLIPWDMKLKTLNKDRRKHAIRIAVLAVIVLCAAALSMNVVPVKRNWYLAQLNGEIKETQSRMKALQPKLRVIESIDRFLQARLILADIIAALEKMLPPTMVLTTFSINNERTLVLQGTALQASEVNMFQRSLLDSGLFSDIKLNYVNKSTTPQGGEVSVFQFTCQIGGQKI